MYSLILDSATKILYIGILKDDNLIDELYLEGRSDHAKNIVYKLDIILKNNNLKLDDIDNVIVGIGPGSYTGVRMAVCVAKMIAVFLNKDLYTISTLKLISSGYNGIIRVSLDARRGNSFSLIYDKNNDKIILDEGMYDNNYLDTFKYDNLVTDDNIKIDAKYIYLNKKKVDNPHLLVPNYLRETEAERNLNDKKNAA